MRKTRIWLLFQRRKKNGFGCLKFLDMADAVMNKFRERKDRVSVL